MVARLNETSEARKEVTILTRKAAREVGGHQKAQRGQKQRKETRKKESSNGKGECMATSAWSCGEERTWESLRRKS